MTHILFLFISYIVDNIWTHDKDLPAIRNEQGHYNNQVRIKTAREGIMLIKHPREDNLIQAAAAKGQLISNCPFGVFQKKKKKKSRISALASKKRSNQKYKDILYR